MRCSSITTCLLFATIVVIGCRQDAGTAPSKPVAQEKTTPKTEEPDLAFLRYDTGDVKNWPDYRFPLHHSFDTPDVPPQIIGPFSAEDIPNEE